MNRYIKEFLHRGLVFAGFGPIILGIIYAILQEAIPGFSLSGGQICLGIVSIYLLAFLQAGASVFPQIDHWPLLKVLLCHFVTLYSAYVGCYLINSWIPFRIEVLAIFTAIFVVSYAIVWLWVFLSAKIIQKKLNQKLNP